MTIHAQLLIPAKTWNIRVEKLIQTYASLFEKVVIALDTKFESSKSSSVALPNNVEIADFRSGDAWIDSYIFKFSQSLDADWVFRLDDDECIGSDLIQLLQDGSILKQSTSPVVGFSRTWCLFQDHQTLSLPTLTRLGFDFQARLFKPHDLQPNDEVHGPGFSIPDSIAYADPKFRLFHFNWIVKSYRERKETLFHYDKQKPGYLRDHLHYYLWERDPDLFFSLRPETDPMASHYAKTLDESGALLTSRYDKLELAHLIQEAAVSENLRQT